MMREKVEDATCRQWRVSLDEGWRGEMERNGRDQAHGRWGVCFRPTLGSAAAVDDDGVYELRTLVN